MTSLVYRLLVVILMAVFCGHASAADIKWTVNLSGTHISDDPTASCTAALAALNAANGGTKPFHSILLTASSGGFPSTYSCRRTSSGQPEGYASAVRSGTTCTAPKVVNTSTGVCENPNCLPPKLMIGGVCSNPPPVCVKDEKWVAHTAYCPAPKNWGGCEVTVIKLLASYKLDNQCTWEVMKTGNQAGADPDVSQNPQPPAPKGPPAVSPPVPPKPDGNCPEGTVQMGQTASGAPICVGTGSNPPNTPPPPTGSGAPSTSTGTDGTATTVTTNTTQNHDGSSTTITTTTVVKPDGSKSTTSTGSTTANAGGQPGKSDVGDKDKTFCQQNPTLTICINSSVSGTCGQVSCTGDAIQCATLRAAAAMECREREDMEKILASPQKALGDQILAGNDPMQGQIDTAMRGTEVDFANPNLDSSGFLSGGQCLAPMVFAVSGRVVSFSFADICEHIQPLRLLVMAICSIFSYLVVARSVLGS